MRQILQKILTALEPTILFLKKNQIFIAVLVILTVFGFIFYRIGYFNTLEPSEANIEEKLLTVKRPKIDKSVVEKLEKLENQNIQVQSLFNQARENPFKE